jgi:hypothetical protein
MYLYINCKAIGLCTVRGTAGHVLHAKAGHVVSYIRCSTPGVFQCWNIRTFLWLAWRSGVELRPDINYYVKGLLEFYNNEEDMLPTPKPLRKPRK